MTESFDIKTKAPYPAGALSNFAPHSFTFDGREQERVCRLAGPVAQSVGRKHDWRFTGTLWWRGKPYDRLSDEYQGLLDRAYQALFDQSERFRSALAATGAARLTHTIGKSDPCETTLTAEELHAARTSARRRISTAGLTLPPCDKLAPKQNA